MKVALACLLLVVAGCASTRTIKQARDVSTSGLAYTAAVDRLIVETRDRLIDSDSLELARSRPPAAQPNSAAVAASRLEEKERALATTLTELDKFRLHNNLLAAYFLNLQALADSPVKNDTGTAVKALATSISKLNGRFARVGESADQLGGLAALAAAGVQAGHLRKTFTEDAELIAASIRIHRTQIANIEAMATDRFLIANDLHYANQVRSPFTDTGKPLPKDWAGNRRAAVKARFSGETFATASQAADVLIATWTDIIQGKPDTGAVRLLISDLGEFVAVADRDAGKSR